MSNPLFLLHMQAQKKKLSKRKRRNRDFALCGARRGLRVPPSRRRRHTCFAYVSIPRLRKPLKRLDLNFMVSEIFYFLPKNGFHEKETAKSPEKSGLFVYFFARASITGLTNRKSNIPTARIAAIPRISVHSFASFSPYWRTALCFASSEM